MAFPIRHRKTKDDFKPRCINIDILFYGDKVICDDDFIVPHPLLHHRLFVLESLSELLPDFVHPVLNDTRKMLLSHKKEGVYAC